MAGPVTHMMVALRAADPSAISTIDRDLQAALLRHQSFLRLGSIGPDLPAILDAGFKQHVSDWLHDGKLRSRVPTNTTVVELYDKLKGMSPDCAAFAFLCGWVAHTVTDVIVHPIVNDAVNGNLLEHRNCETVQDALLFYEYRRSDLKHTDFLAQVRVCGEPAHAHELAATIELWQPIVREYYGDYSCRAWVSSYETAFSIARQAVHYDGYSYPRREQITDDELRRFYTEIKLPVTDKIGRFNTDVVPKAVRATAALWHQIYRRFLDPRDRQDISDLVPDWDLNTGQNMTTERTFDLWREP